MNRPEAVGGLLRLDDVRFAPDHEDFDSHVDQSDFAVFQRCISGPDVLADAGCAG